MVESKSDSRSLNSAALELRNGLTGIQEPIHWPATQESGGSDLDELDRIAVEDFLDTLADIAIRVATRQAAEHEARDE